MERMLRKGVCRVARSFVAWPLRSLSLTPLVTAIAVVVANVTEFLGWCAGPIECHEILAWTFMLR